MKIMVLGIGNVLLRDEGVGVRAVEELQRRYRFSDDVELLDGGTAGIELLRHLAGKEHLFIIDALRAGKTPGAVLRVEGEEIPVQFMTRISPHQLGLSDVLAAGTLSNELPEKIVLFGIEPKSLEAGLGLSDEVEDGLEKLLEAVVAELRSIGCHVESRGVDVSRGIGLWEPAQSLRSGKAAGEDEPPGIEVQRKATVQVVERGAKEEHS